MCETHIVYNLCGHVRIKTVVQCAEMIDALLASILQATCSQRLCANSAGHETDNAENIHIFPDICDKCTRNGVVGILMREQPSVKIDLIRAWKKDTHLKKQNQGQSQDQKEMESAAEGLQIASPSGESSSAVDSTKDSEHDTSGIIAETQPVAVSDLAGASMTDAASHPSISSPSDGHGDIPGDLCRVVFISIVGAGPRICKDAYQRIENSNGSAFVSPSYVQVDERKINHLRRIYHENLLEWDLVRCLQIMAFQR